MNKCALCDGKIKAIESDYSFDTKNLGNVVIQNVMMEECIECHDRTLSIESSQFIYDYVRDLERECLGKLPIDDYISTNEAIEILGISKQAFSKNPKIKRGFIYGIKKGNKILYNKKSVLLFKEKNDGRFKLQNHSNSIWFSSVSMINRQIWLKSGYSDTTDNEKLPSATIENKNYLLQANS